MVLVYLRIAFSQIKNIYIYIYILNRVALFDSSTVEIDVKYLFKVSDFFFKVRKRQTDYHLGFSKVV